MPKLLMLILFFFPEFIFGQGRRIAVDSAKAADTISHLHLIAKNYGDSVVLRWAPGDATSWILAQKKGYLISRTVYEKDARGNFIQTGTNTSRIPVWKMEQWQQYFANTHDSLAAMAAELLYGKTLPLKEDSLSLQGILNKYREQQNRYGFALMIADFNANIAKGLGLRYADRSIDGNHYYAYTVSPVDSQNMIKSDTALVFINGKQMQRPVPPLKVNIVPGDRQVHLFWYNNLSEASYSGFYIERSTDGKNFVRLNHLPFVYSRKAEGLPKPIEYVDSGVTNYKKYYYRIYGITAFADLSLPSSIAVGMATDLTPPHAPVITGIKAIENGSKITFHWEKADKEADFEGYIVGRGENLKGPFEPLNEQPLSFDAHDFTDEHPNTNAPNYYIVAAVDTAGNAGHSMPAYMNAEDHTPPARPTGLEGDIDSAGKVSVRWNWNKEDDLAGYRIFFSNAAKDIFTPVGAALLTDTLFTDSITLKTLTKKIFYQVIAYDRNMNASPASEILELNKPDIIPPVAAIIHGFNVSDTGVALQWYRSASDDVASQKLFRKEDSTEIWALLGELPVNDTTFTDTTVKSKHHYAYAIETFDSSGLSSGKSFPLKVYVYDKGYKEIIRGFKVTKSDGSAVLSWSSPETEVSYYILYKGENNKGLKMAGNIPGDKLSYEESPGTGNFQYAIKAVYKGGHESAVSEVMTLAVE